MHPPLPLEKGWGEGWWKAELPVATLTPTLSRKREREFPRPARNVVSIGPR